MKTTMTVENIDTNQLLKDFRQLCEEDLLGLISNLIGMDGGRELIKTFTNGYGQTALHCACRNENISLDIISKLLEVGGRDLLMMTDQYYGHTALHHACKYKNITLDIISKLLDVGGRELLMMTGFNGRTALHEACLNKSISIDIISKLLDVGGRDLLMMTNKDGHTALHYGYYHYHSVRHDFNDSFMLLVKESILVNAGGEFGVGSLFNSATDYVQQQIYRKWNDFSPALKSVVDSLQGHQQPPILHAAILAKAPLHVIENIISQFEYSILKGDSLNRCPLAVALEVGLEWDDGLKEVMDATPIYTSAQYGLKWTNHMKEQVEENVDEIINGHDSLTGLPLFMVAAMGDYHDLSSVYSMMRMSPKNVL